MSCRSTTWASASVCATITAWPICPSPTIASRWPSLGGRIAPSPCGISGADSINRSHEVEPVVLPTPRSWLPWRLDVDFDILIAGGWVIDGGGGPAFRADVAVLDDRVAEVGRLPGARAAE